ncbi:protein YgfX [Wielerella bovis]|uniref:protein YgfX n=1 Tax=Wielerella bovis TaxID=2917790 RepID=UPI002019AD11|nr:protein YgfX [Wielerella bovis]MCG7656657.1 hypothetical protein [Wielerella bovis]MCG7658882.1 hypothetical protein [Wielerella bovis]
MKFSVEFVPSNLRRFVVVVFGVATACLVLFHFSAGIKWTLLLAILLATAWAWRESPLFVHRLVVDEQGFATIFVNHTAWEADLLSGSFLTRWLCVLKWRTNRHMIWQAVLPDMMSKEDYRCVLVWARWGQPTKTQRKQRAVQRGEQKW